ncbi:hypothetical protein D3C80_1374050 [compost metagenome]
MGDAFDHFTEGTRRAFKPTEAFGHQGAVHAMGLERVDHIAGYVALAVELTEASPITNTVKQGLEGRARGERRHRRGTQAKRFHGLSPSQARFLY